MNPNQPLQSVLFDQEKQYGSSSADGLSFYQAQPGQYQQQQPGQYQQQQQQQYDYSQYKTQSTAGFVPIERTFVGSPFGTGGYRQLYFRLWNSLIYSWCSDEPPLLEELGINFSHIKTKSVSVLNVFKMPDSHIMDDTDLAGPLFFCLLFGSFLLLSGKVHFGFIYGVALVGCISMHLILNLMSSVGIDFARTTSVLGYCMLPLVLLSIISTLLSLTGVVGIILSTMSILWCTYSASTMFVTVLAMKDQRVLVAYPVLLLYAVFGLFTVF